MKKDKSTECTASIVAVRDALYVLNGKWKLPVIVALSNGPQRFNEIQKLLENITPKVLANELRELELNQFVVRKVVTSTQVTVLYELTDYSKSLDSVLLELRKWGFKHRERILGHRKKI
jgi:DNA-binding HxlR family transcriptional regulator